MNYADVLTLCVLFIVIAFSVSKVIKNKKNGKCSCGCDSCPNSSFCSKGVEGRNR